jgi:cytochrome c biogenesis protein CcmG, thiol:disulfide interchange protein DsbE
MSVTRTIPLLVFLVLCGFLWKGLHLQPKVMPSAMIGKTVPESLKRKGSPYLIHFWASWCDSCEQEQSLIAQWVDAKHIPILGVNYKDNPEQSKSFINLWGRSYVAMIADDSGHLGFDLGVISTPETFIVDKNGIIQYRHQGALNRDVIEHEIEPILRELNEHV